MPHSTNIRRDQDQAPKRKIKFLGFLAGARMINPCERRSVACLLLAIIAVVAAASYDRERLEIAKQILEEVPLTDGHNDLPWNIRKFLRNQINEFELNTDLTMVEPWSISKYSHTDLPRLQTGMVGAQQIASHALSGKYNPEKKFWVNSILLQNMANIVESSFSR
ncbi:hypothetical protein PYW08_000650 [Mythimna loreyi]|uniref:Uncharacterized protein n=1 Tax=Mythimna loreyi TaxID=667449 RepID=A0ACC2RD51_9NEOP|nr:hypothetical protein PYW08_000650 [Mythimna loreyi]